METIFKNAKVVLPDRVVDAHVRVQDGIITDICDGPSNLPAEDLQSHFLIPGLVELHTDHLEQHYHPRPGVTWPAMSAVMAHDAQIAASGITTVFDALRAGTFEPEDLSAKYAVGLLNAIQEARNTDYLRADHFIHLRCEMPCHDTAEAVEDICAAGRIDLMSIMDHTPGARQFVSLDKFKEYYLGRKILSADAIDGYIAERLALQAKHAAHNKKVTLALAKSRNIKLASHDDATLAHVDEAVEDGVAIAEFPTTMEAAEAAHAKGLAVLMGAPNIVRGGSHSGNVSAADVAKARTLDVLSSDYVPTSLLNAAFNIPARVEGYELPDALRLVTLNPAKAMGLHDRGSIEIGKRADFVEVSMTAAMPVVRRVWREGQRVI
jgi:alpha-D-ribose 1-methylphosphonate 5-triphosphate diphosphatase